MTTYGAWLSEALTTLRCTRATLAEVSGVKLATIGSILFGSIQNPSKETWEKIEAAVMGMETGVIPYKKKGKQNNDTLVSGEPARYAVLTLERGVGWTVHGIYPSYKEAVQVASPLLPIRGGTSVDVFVFKETDF